MNAGAEPVRPVDLYRPDAGPPATPGEPVNILLVDDHVENLLALEAVLEPLGQRLVRAQSGEQALRRLLHEEFAVVLLDVRMPDMDGFQTARYISGRARTRHIPIIFLTGHDADRIEQAFRGYAAGAVDYVIKPFEPEVLRSKVRVFIELQQERARRIQETQARAEAEAVALAVGKLQAVSDAALAHLEMDELLPQLLARIASLFGADSAGLLLAEDSLDTLLMRAAHGWRPPPGGISVAVGDGFFGRVAGSRAPALLEHVDRTAGLPQAVMASGVQSILAAPLRTAGPVLGVLYLGAGADRFSNDDAALLGLCAERASIAIDHARAYERERAVVTELQRSLLPERLPEIPGLPLAAQYRPAEAAMQVGGDWYDAIELPGGRAGLAIGDVVGHGIRAAAVMSELRSSLRAFAIEGHTPAGTLKRLDALVQATHGEEMVATALFLVIDVEARRATFASAGHLPPLVRLPDGVVRYAEQEVAPPLGIGHTVNFPESSLELPDGATVLLFTDGLVERRGEQIDVGLERLRAALATAPEDLGGLCAHVLDRTQQQRSHDDVALLAARLGPLAADSWTLRLPAEPASVPIARHHLRRWLEGVGASRDQQYALQLAVSEAVANAVEHAYGPGDHDLEVAVDLRGRELVLEVRDSGDWRPPRGRDRGHGLRLIEQVAGHLEIDRHERGTVVRVRQALALATDRATERTG